MPAPVTYREAGFSLPEVMVSIILLVMVITALSGYQQALFKSTVMQSQSRQVWRYAMYQVEDPPAISLPEGWQVMRATTPVDQCFRVSVTVISPSGRQGALSRLHCA